MSLKDSFFHFLPKVVQPVNRVPMDSQGPQRLQFCQFPELVHISDIVAMEVQAFYVFELANTVRNFY